MDVDRRTDRLALRLFHGEWPEQIPGDEHGDVEYAITRAEWDAHGKATVDSSGRAS